MFTEKNIVTKNEDGTETTTKGYDMDAVYKAVSSFVDNYNKVIDNVSKSDSSAVKNAAKNMTNITNMYANSLKDIGITIGDDNKLTVKISHGLYVKICRKYFVTGIICQFICHT